MICKFIHGKLIQAMIIFMLFTNVINGDDKGLLVLPIIGYAPETKVEYGLKAEYFYKSSEKATARPSTISPMLTFTTKKQVLAEMVFDLYFLDDNYHIISELYYLKYPDLYSGIGNDINIDDEVKYTPIKKKFILSLEKKIISDLHLGLSYDYHNMKLTDNHLKNSNLPIPYGIKGGPSSGMGILIKWDTRDNICAPYTGEYFHLSNIIFSQFFGSKYKLNLLKIDMRKYFLLSNNHVLAIQGNIQSSTRDVPFDMLPRLGSDTILRGYHNSLYRDKSMWAVQSEYRYLITQSIGVVGFVGLGDILPQISSIDETRLKYSYGMGFRWFIETEERMSVRFDFAIGEESTGFYISFLEAF